MEYCKETVPTVLEVTRFHRYSRKLLISLEIISQIIRRHNHLKFHTHTHTHKHKTLNENFYLRSVGSINMNNGQKIRQNLRDPPDMKS